MQLLSCAIYLQNPWDGMEWAVKVKTFSLSFQRNFTVEMVCCRIYRIGGPSFLFYFLKMASLNQFFSFSRVYKEMLNPIPSTFYINFNYFHCVNILEFISN